MSFCIIDTICIHLIVLGSDQDPVDRISSPTNAPLASSTLKTRDIKIESLYRSRVQDRPPDPPSGRYDQDLMTCYHYSRLNTKPSKVDIPF